MNKRSLLRLSVGMLILANLGLPAGASAQQWPERRVTIVTPFSPGVSPDVAARILAEGLSKRWKQSVVVENRPGADTMIGTKAFIDRSDPHTLLFTTHATFTVVPLLYANVPFDPVKDVSPISLAVEDFIGIVAAPDLPASSLPEFIELARSKPGKFNFFAVPGVPHLAYLALQRRTGIDTTFVAYANPGAAVSDMTEGRIHVAVLPLAMVLGQVRAGKLKLLAVTNAERAPAAPTAPTVVEAGQPAMAFGGLLGMFGSKDMPAALRERIAADLAAVLAEPDTIRRLQEVGLIARGSTPAQFAAALDVQRAKWSAVALENNITPQQPR